jgi:acyl-CoA synthetase (AMP-forming)/AMP-acid ligase II
VNVNVNLAPQELAHILADSGADIIVASPEFAPALQAAAAAASAAAAAAAATAAAEAEAAYPAPNTTASASAAVDVGALCVHAAVWTLPGQPLQNPILASASPMRLPQVSGTRSCGYPYGMYVRTDITGAPVVLSADVAGVTTEEDQALDELSAFGGRPEGDPEDGYQMYYTSGTTGRPKGVLLSHRVVVLHAIGTILGE